MTPSRKRIDPVRRGIAFLAIVFLLLLVVVGATQTLVRGELAARRNESDRIRTRTLAMAIDVTKRQQVWEMTLPIDAEKNERIEVMANENRSQYTARWLRGQQQLDTFTHVIANRAELSDE